MNVVSWCDGVSCGQQALKKAHVKYRTYVSFENNKNLHKVILKNHPNTVIMDDIKQCQYVKNIDLFMAGPPCQGFSFAGKNLEFNDPRSKLFLNTINFIKTNKPKYFLIENVVMRDECRILLDEMIGIKSIEINSNHFSAQNRARLYWTNIPFNKNIKSTGPVLKDIIQYDVDPKYFVVHNYLKKDHDCQYFVKHQKIAGELLLKSNDPICCRDQGRRLTPDGKRRDDKNGTIRRGYEFRSDGKTNTITTTTRDNSFMVNGIIRKPTPIEFERLQNLPDGYTSLLSESARYHAVGNGWTIGVIAYILKNII